MFRCPVKSDMSPVDVAATNQLLTSPLAAQASPAQSTALRLIRWWAATLQRNRRLAESTTEHPPPVVRVLRNACLRASLHLYVLRSYFLLSMCCSIPNNSEGPVRVGHFESTVALCVFAMRGNRRCYRISRRARTHTIEEHAMLQETKRTRDTRAGDRKT